MVWKLDMKGVMRKKICPQIKNRQEGGGGQNTPPPLGKLLNLNQLSISRVKRLIWRKLKKGFKCEPLNIGAATSFLNKVNWRIYRVSITHFFKLFLAPWIIIHLISSWKVCTVNLYISGNRSSRGHKIIFSWCVTN